MTVTLRAWHSASRGRDCHNAAALPGVRLDADAWQREDARLLQFDKLVHAGEEQHPHGFVLELEGSEASIECARPQISLRYQRLFARRNRASDHARFDALLARHEALHDRGKPLVRADHDHALDVWQWTLKLAPDASEALQIAALFHDIERLTSESEARVEQHAPDYLAFKQRHAQHGAALLEAELRKLALEPAVARRACALVARHEQPEDDRELETLNDADALSWFALNSPGYLAYFGLEQTSKKLAYTLARMRSPLARSLLARVKLENELAALLAEASLAQCQA